MNRTITFLGLFVLLFGIGLIASPIVLNGVETVTPWLELGIFVLPVGLTTILWGASSPNPGVTTIAGILGNPEENVMRRAESGPTRTYDVRYLPGPREPVNCRHCYTLIPWNAAECPRCGRRRECRACGRLLFFLSGAVRCLPCVRDETFCNCPRLRKTPVAPGMAGRTARG
ncbi:MAG TPA: hypothetical protein VEY07_01625 [Thermoplasmata archaeon]|nr:hypothetical protein [Thermoplasmata archaeon]